MPVSRVGQFLSICGIPQSLNVVLRPFSYSASRLAYRSEPTRSLSGKVALVTGGSRGVSKGIALQLADAGAKVYITGREPSNPNLTKDSGFPTLQDTVNEIEKRGGQGVLAFCDHSDPKQTEEVFKKISQENNGTLDILVNAAFAGNPSIEKNGGKKFYECDPLFWDDVNNVGLRNIYICCVHAGRMMANKRRGLIVNISSAGGLQYFFNVPYGVGKAAIDRMSADMAMDLKPVGVNVVTLWPGTVKTETSKKLIYSGKFTALTGVPENVAMNLLENGETPEFVGKAVVCLASDPKISRKTGKILLTGDLSKEYGFVDIDNKDPLNMRSLNGALQFMGYPTLAKVVPKFVKVPSLALHMSSYKFYKL